MNKRLMIAIFSLSLILSVVSSEALGEAPDDNDIEDLYHNILIGELFPSGKVYLERLSLNGGAYYSQNFEGFNYSEEIEIYPLKKTKWNSVSASLSRLIKGKYIGETEKNSKYFKYPFAKPPQDALLYEAKKKRTDTPMKVVSFNNYQIEKVTYFGVSDIREYSDKDYEAAMKHIGDDHKRKDKYGSTLSKIDTASTILNARKIALFSIKKVDYNVLLSVYNTHGGEYASIVYVSDFILNGKVIFTKEKYNIDGPY